MGEKEYWEVVRYIRDDIFDRMIEAGIKVKKDVGDVQPRFKQLVNNGGIGLTMDAGVPEGLCTPLGALDIRQHGFSTDNISMKKFMSELTELYGLVLTVPIIRNYIGDIGPIYSITRVPGLDVTFPKIQFKRYEDYIDESIALAQYRLINGEQETRSNVK